MGMETTMESEAAMKSETAMESETAAPFVLAVCGVKNSGKTTCMEQLIKIFSGRGYRVAAIKHDGHDFQPDVPGTDSFRMQQAGAEATAVFSEKRVLLYKKRKTELEELLAVFSDCDIILVEGFKTSKLPKIEVVRNHISTEPVSNPKGRMGIVTDIPGFSREGERVWRFEDMEILADEVEAMRQKGVFGWEK